MGKELRRRIHIIAHYLAFGGNGWSEQVSIDLESKAEAEELVAPQSPHRRREKLGSAALFQEHLWAELSGETTRLGAHFAASRVESWSTTEDSKEL